MSIDPSIAGYFNNINDIIDRTVIFLTLSLSRLIAGSLTTEIRFERAEVSSTEATWYGTAVYQLNVYEDTV